MIKAAATTPIFLAELNHYRKVLGMKKVKDPRGSMASLVEAINALALKAAAKGDEKAKARVAVKLPTVVAEGAYADNRIAEERTGHTKQGKTKAQAKHEKRVAKHIEKVTGKGVTAVKEVPSKGKQGGARPRTLAEGEMTLAQIGDHIGKPSKWSRARARKNVAALDKLAIRKYVFRTGDRDKVAAILKG